MNEKTNSHSSKFFGDAVIITLITGFGYLVTSLVESSYVNYFGISANASLVSPPVTEIIWVTSAVCILAISCLLIAKPIYGFFALKIENKKNTVLYRGWSLFFAYLLPLMIFKILILHEITLSFIIEFVFIILLFMIVTWIIFLFIKKDEKPKDYGLLNNLFLNSHLDNLVGKDLAISGLFFILFFGVILVFNLAPDYGTSVAKRKTIYDVISSNPPLAVVAQYQDILIAEPFDQDNKQLIYQIHLININTLEERGLYLSKETIGPFQPFMETRNIWDKIADWIEVPWQKQKK